MMKEKEGLSTLRGGELSLKKRVQRFRTRFGAAAALPDDAHNLAKELGHLILEIEKLTERQIQSGRLLERCLSGASLWSTEPHQTPDRLESHSSEKTIRPSVEKHTPESAFPDLIEEVLAVPQARRGYAAQGILLEFGAWVRDRRLRQDLTLEALAESIGTTPAQLSLIERGIGKRGPTLDLVDRILSALGYKLSLPEENR